MSTTSGRGCTKLGVGRSKRKFALLVACMSILDDGIEFINRPFGVRDLLRRIEALLVK